MWRRKVGGILMKTNVTMKDIAEKIGVSSVTVSKALNDKEGVSEELRDRIKRVASEMGYRINTTAKSMKEGYSYNIGVIIPERFIGRNQSFYLHFYQQITTMLEEYHYYGILHMLSSEDEENLTLPRIYYEKKVDGFIILGQISNSYAELLKKTEVPFVFLDFYTDQAEIDSIISDSFYGVYELTNYLIDQGHRKIAFVGNIYSTSSIQDRFLGYYKSLLEHKIELNKDYIIPDRDDRGEYIDIRLPADLPTAFVCNCDEVAYNLINKLKKAGYHVPDDFSVVGFDNDIYSTISDPKITTIEVNVAEMSRIAVRTIIQKIKNKERKFGRLMVKGKVIYRDSVKNLRAR